MYSEIKQIVAEKKMKWKENSRGSTNSKVLLNSLKFRYTVKSAFGFCSVGKKIQMQTMEFTLHGM